MSLSYINEIKYTLHSVPYNKALSQPQMASPFRFFSYIVNYNVLDLNGKVDMSEMHLTDQSTHIIKTSRINPMTSHIHQEIKKQQK